MPKVRVKFLLTLIFLLPVLSVLADNKKKKVEYDPSSPSSVVKAANQMIVLGDFEQMLDITEYSEKKRTEETIKSIEENPSLLPLIIKEANKIEFFEITGEEIYTNKKGEIAVVHTKWHLVRDKQKKLPKGVKKIQPQESEQLLPYTIAWMDYLLKKFDGKWKIISKKSR